MRLAVWLCACAVLAGADGRRFGGGGSRRVPSSPKRPPAPRPQTPTRTDTGVNNHFLANERGTAAGNTHNRPNPFSNPSPQVPHTPLGFDKVNAPSAPKAPPMQSNGPIGFDKINSAGTQQGTHQIGFDKVNSEAAKKTPSAPPYPNGPPPVYHPTGNNYGGAGAGDHPPSYPGRPVNAPPSYSANNPYNPAHTGNYPQQHQYPAQGFGASYPQQNQFGGVGHSYPQGGSYPSNNGYFPTSGNYPHGTSYQGNNYGGSPFANTGYNGNSYYNPSNFGYSSNPGYFGQSGYNNYPGQYDNHKKSRFGGLPIPIPIPIPIPLGGGGFGGLSGFGGYSHNHQLLNSFVKNQNNTKSDNSSTSVFILNNSTVTPCTTDHFVYDLLKVTVVSCTAETCTAVKIYATTNISNVVSVHSAGFTMCLEDSVTLSHFGNKVTPSVSNLRWENSTVCRDVANTTLAGSNTTVAGSNVTVEGSNTTVAGSNVTVEGSNTMIADSNATEGVSNATATDGNITEVPTTTVAEDLTTTVVPTTTNHSLANTTRVCEKVNCSLVKLCLPSIEVLDQCVGQDCPFRRTGFEPCVNLRMCRSPSAPLSSFATLNTTISKIDEFNNRNSVFDATNLTLISFHKPIIRFDCPLNGTAPGCPPNPSTNFSAPVA